MVNGEITACEAMVLNIITMLYNKRGEKAVVCSCRFFAENYNMSKSTYLKAINKLVELGAILIEHGRKDTLLVTPTVPKNGTDASTNSSSDSSTDSSSNSSSDAMTINNPNTLNTKELNTNIDSVEVAEATTPANNLPPKDVKKKESKAFVKPDYNEIVNFCIERCLSKGKTQNDAQVLAEKFWSGMEASGWRLKSGIKVQSWKGAVNTWILNMDNFNQKPKTDGVRSAQSRPLGLD